MRRNFIWILLMVVVLVVPTTAQTITWQQVARQVGTVRGIAATSNGWLFAVGSGVFRSEDGVTWERVVPDSGFSIAINSDVILVGVSGGIIRSRDGGDTWTTLNLPPVPGLTEYLVSNIAVTPSGTIIASVINPNNPGGALLRSTDDGVTWEVQRHIAGASLFPVLGVNNGSVFVGTGAGMFRSTDDGRTWVSVSRGMYDHRIQAIAFGSGFVFAGTTGGAGYLEGGVARSSDDGETWTDVGLNGLSINTLFADDSGLYAGLTGRNGVRRSNDNGLSWTPVNDGLMDQTTRAVPTDVVAIAIESGYIYAGTSSGIFRAPL